jgi:TetR/AcrR family transcriptional repressor of nem operon
MGRPKQFDPDVAVDKAMEVFWRKGYASTSP